MSRPHQRLDDVLRHTSTLSPLLARIAAGKKVAKHLVGLCRKVVPGLDVLSPGVCDLRAGVLHITCQSTAQANKLRQIVPRLQQELADQGIDLTQIKISVQPSRIPANTGESEGALDNTVRPTQPNPLKNKSTAVKILHFSQNLSNAVKPGPLQDALLRLACAAQKRLASAQASNQTHHQQNQEKNEANT